MIIVNEVTVVVKNNFAKSLFTNSCIIQYIFHVIEIQYIIIREKLKILSRS